MAAVKEKEIQEIICEQSIPQKTFMIFMKMICRTYLISVTS